MEVKSGIGATNSDRMLVTTTVLLTVSVEPLVVLIEASSKAVAKIAEE